MASMAVVVRRRKLYSGSKVALDSGAITRPCRTMHPSPLFLKKPDSWVHRNAARVPIAEPVRPTCHLRMGNIIVGKKALRLHLSGSGEPTSPAVSGSILKGIMEDNDNFDSPHAIMEMRRRHLRLALELQQLGGQGLAELRERGELTVEECAELLADGLKLERKAGPSGSRKRH
jgi:hypothetical protein